MILRPRPSLFDILFAVRGLILPRTVAQLVLIAGISASAVGEADLPLEPQNFVPL